MNRIYKLGIALFAAVWLTSSAMAFSGLSIGVVASGNDLDTYGSETDNGTVGDTSIETDQVSSTSKSASEQAVSFFAEYTTPQGSSFGIEYFPGSATLGSGERSDTGSNDEAAGAATIDTYTAKADVSDIITLYIEPTYMVNDTFGIYGKIGGTQLTVNTLEVLANGTDSSDYPDDKIWGSMYGIGAKMMSPWGLFLKLESTVTNFETIDLHSVTGNNNKISADLDMESIRAAIGYNF